MTSLAILAGCLSLIGWTYLALFRARFWQPLPTFPVSNRGEQPSVDIVIPARNEAEMLPTTLPALLNQDYRGQWKIILVDDNSTDNTAALGTLIATREGKQDRLQVISAPHLADNWSGKVAAMQAGYLAGQGDYILFTDADVRHPTQSLWYLISRAIERRLDLVSLMVKLHCKTPAEKLLIPAYIFFFAMLFPFRRVNNPASPIAAAAGGVMLVRRKSLDAIGGFTRMKNALIDDCALAKLIKQEGGADNGRGKIELTLSRQVESLRVYQYTEDVWKLISRTAFTQLNYSVELLIGTILGMTLLFLAPPLLTVSSYILLAGLGISAWIVMILIYMPTVQFYDLPILWVMTLPVAGIIYIAATIDSARLYWQGRGGEWKGRKQA